MKVLLGKSRINQQKGDYPARLITIFVLKIEKFKSLKWTIS